MDENASVNQYLRVTNKELFYSAMMLNLDRLVGVEYVFPADGEKLAKELSEAKRSLHRKKLLKENSKGEVTLDFALSACAKFCAAPDKCVAVDEPGYCATVYAAADSFMLMECGGEENTAQWFDSMESLNDHITLKLADIKTVDADNAGKKEAKAGGGV